MREIANRYKSVRCFGLWGSFSDSLDWVSEFPAPRWFCSLGSVLGNDWHTLAVAGLRRFSALMGPQDRMLLGMDSCKDKVTLWRSYHDSQGLFESFIRNGLEHSNSVMGHEWYHAEDWTVAGLWNANPFMHQFAITATTDVVCGPLKVKLIKGTQIDCYEAFKYAPYEMQHTFEESGLDQIDIWRSSSTKIGECWQRVF
jgi:uncharacterized SAM-dependent methyltransferase